MNLNVSMKMKWLARFLVLSLLLLFTAGLTLAAQPKDVPTDHWAYQAVKQLIDKGYLQLYQDQTFQGDQPVDRYTLATVVMKILNEVAVGEAGTTRHDVEVLRKLTQELQQELVKIIAENNTYSNKNDEMKRSSIVLKEDLIKTIVAVQNNNAEQAALRKEVQEIIDRVVALEQATKDLRQEVEQIKEENRKQRLYLIVAIVLGLAGAAN
jgi:cell division protein FtsB